MNYIIGKIIEISENAIIIECSGIGYTIHVAKIEHYKIGEVKKIYVHSQNINNTNVFIGTESAFELQLIIRLLKLKGVGIKTTIKILNKTKTDEIIELIKQYRKSSHYTS